MGQPIKGYELKDLDILIWVYREKVSEVMASLNEKKENGLISSSEEFREVQLLWSKYINLIESIPSNHKEFSNIGFLQVYESYCRITNREYEEKIKEFLLENSLYLQWKDEVFL